MTRLPDAFAWLAGVPGPLMVIEATKLYGTLEAPGTADNPEIMRWAKETGLSAQGYNKDEVPWCGLSMAVVALRAGKTAPSVPLRALSWARFGIPSPEPSLGDVLVFKRTGGGHVALYVGEDSKNYFCLGGNQGDAVSIVPKPKIRLHACRRPIYRVKPDNVLPVGIGPVGPTFMAVGPDPSSEV